MILAIILLLRLNRGHTHTYSFMPLGDGSIPGIASEGWKIPLSENQVGCYQLVQLILERTGWVLTNKCL